MANRILEYRKIIFFKKKKKRKEKRKFRHPMAADI
jgi:hypothetical protein